MLASFGRIQCLVVPYTQLFFHFLGGVESMGFFVPNMAEALVKLGHVE